MARKSNSNLDRTYLIKSKEEFKALIKERIGIGEELFERKISDFQELIKLNEDRDFWHDFNLELLRTSFNKQQNRYFNEYDWSPMYTIGSVTPRTPTIEERINDSKSEVDKYLTRLNKIFQKIPLMDEANGISDNNIFKISYSNIDLKKKVAKGELLSVIDELLSKPEYHNNNKKYNELILLLQQVTRVNKEKELGKIAFEEESRVIIRITEAVLKIMDE